METIIMIPSELEHLKSLVKLVRRKKRFKIWWQLGNFGLNAHNNSKNLH